MTAKDKLAILIRTRFPEAVTEYRFHPVRRWRFDWAVVERKIAFEFDGGVFTGGRHTRPVGFSNDREKMNVAQSMGWQVYCFTTAHLSGHAQEILEGI